MSMFTEGASEFFLKEPGAYAPPASQPTEKGSLLTWGDSLRRVATLGHAVNNMSDARAKVDAMCDADPFEACLSSLGAIGEKHKELIASNPPRIMHQLPCPGGPVADFIFAGDSSMALVDCREKYADGTPKKVQRTVGEYLKSGAKDIFGPRVGQVQYAMKWGKGLEQINDAIEECLDHPYRRTPGGDAPAIVVGCVVCRK